MNYIIVEGDDGVYIIDQHAAHERIRYEQIREERSRSVLSVQGLLEPVVFEINLVQSEILKSGLSELVEFGFSLEPFGDQALLVRTVPALLYGKDWRTVLHELLDALTSENKEGWTERIIVSMACHSAVRAGTSLTENEMRELVRQIEEADMPRTCPHGRPIKLHLSLDSLEHEFGRK